MINVTRSLPLGLYIRSFSSTYKKGDFVLIEEKAIGEHQKYLNFYFGSGGLIKNIAALPGDTFVVQDDNFRLSNPVIDIKIKEKTPSGLRIPRLPNGVYTVPIGYFLPLATYNENSLDGRYYGVLPMESIKVKLVPLITF